MINSIDHLIDLIEKSFRYFIVKFFSRFMYSEKKFAELARHSYDAWAELEKESGLQLMHKTGGLMWTLADSGRASVIEAYWDTMDKFGGKSMKMTGKDIKKRWPQFEIPDDAIGAFDPDAGLVDPILGNAAHQQLAKGKGAKILAEAKVLSVEKFNSKQTKVFFSI